jgi:hypothetical protein
VCFYIFFEIRNILVGAHKYLYCLNNNYAIYGKIQFFTIFIETLNTNGYLSFFFFIISLGIKNFKLYENVPNFFINN